MRPRGRLWLSSVLSVAACVSADAQVSPRLSVSLLQNRQVDISWPESATGFVLEETDSLAGVVGWSGVSLGSRVDQGVFRVTVDPGVGSRFFRLRLASSSPLQVSLSTTFTGGKAEEGQLMLVWAIVNGDAQVRTVEFLLDDQIASSLTNSPFEASLVTPLRSADKTNFTLQARVTDIGGKAVLSDKQVFQLVSDVRPPRIVESYPAPGSLYAPIDTVEVLFAEPIQPELVTPDSVRLIRLGASDLRGQAADEVVPDVKVELRRDRKSLVIRSTSKLRPGFYGIQIRPPLADLVGNPVVSFLGRFRIFDPTDSDQDGVPDELEASLGLVVGKIDSDGNGRNDGLEDFDKDGLTNGFEVLQGTDPARADTDGNGIKDGDEDTDRDGLIDAQEALSGTDVRRADTDGDGWTDEAEASIGSNPLDSRSAPELLVMIAQPAIEFVLPVAPQLALEDIGLTMARPSLAGLVPVIPQFDLTEAGVALANPAVSLVLPAAPLLELADSGLTLARPSVELVLPHAPQLQTEDAGTTLAAPLVTLQINNNNIVIQHIR